MRPFRVTIATFLAGIAVVAIGLTAMKQATPIWASVAFCLALAILLVTTLSAIVGPADRRAGPCGFALFAWVYLAMVFGPWGKQDIPPMPHTWMARALVDYLYPHTVYDEPISISTISTGPTWSSAAAPARPMPPPLARRPGERPPIGPRAGRAALRSDRPANRPRIGRPQPRTSRAVRNPSPLRGRGTSRSDWVRGRPPPHALASRAGPGSVTFR